jgi:RNA polymerase I-specific transcription initiation factor RRN3
MLVRNFSQPTFKHKVSQTQLVKKMQEVHPRVHAALHKISYLIPLAPWNLVSILAQNMRKIDKKDPVSFFFFGYSLDYVTVRSYWW